MSLRFTAAAATLACAVLAAAPAAAQTQQGDTQPPAAQQPIEVDITEAKLDAFADAAIAVLRVRDSWNPRIEAAGSEAEARRMIETARAEMKQAVEDSPGITAQEYLIIAREAGDNGDLAEAIDERVRARQRSGQ